jgi:hypothetical protein
MTFIVGVVFLRETKDADIVAGSARPGWRSRSRDRRGGESRLACEPWPASAGPFFYPKKADRPVYTCQRWILDGVGHHGSEY